MIEQQLTGRALLALEKIPAVTALFTVSGEYDMVAAESTGKLNQLLDDIAALPGVVRTNFSVILATKLRRWIYFQSWNDYLLQYGRGCPRDT